jgi:hypothetical protein
MDFRIVVACPALTGNAALAADAGTARLSLSQQQAQAPALQRNYELAIARATVAQVPLFTRDYYDGEIGASLAAQDAARENLVRTRAIAESEVSTALSALNSAAAGLSAFA